MIRRKAIGAKETDEPDPRDGGVQSVDRALVIIETLAEDDEGYRLSDLAIRTGLSTSTVHRLLATLEKRRFVQFDRSELKWHVGAQSFSVGATFTRRRNFTAQEAASGAPVAIMSASTVRRFWPNENPLGKHFKLDMDPHFGGAFTDFEVIGIVRDVRFDNPTRIDPTHVYLPAGAPGARAVALTHHSTLEVLVRFQGNRQGALSAVETAMEAFDKNLLPSLRLINVLRPVQLPWRVNRPVHVR